ncbi:MAB_1171c family putative transporter [Streptomyces sp. NPDC050619]|uniref:MAB_1171c family putative transporter n=1 Tax=Streptomyces sp. NPDC050619 TaxID=3157214 RepID=UPI00343355DF
MTASVEHVFNYTHTVSCVITLSAFGYKWFDLRRDAGNLELWALCGTRLFNGIAYLFLVPLVNVWIGELTGIPNLATLLGHSSIVLAALSAHVMVLGWFQSPAESRRRLPRVVGFYLLAIATMSVLFFAAPLPGAHPVDFEVHFATTPTAAAYLMVFLVTYGVSLANTARFTWPSSRAVERSWLAQSLRMTAVGSVFVLGFILGKAIGITGRWFGVTDWDRAAVEWSPIAASLGSLVLVLGYTLPGWGAFFVVRREQFRLYGTLHPLWSVLCEAAPGVTLFRPLSPRVARFWGNLRTRLYRMIIEIRDGQRLLRPYVCDGCEERLRRFLWETGLVRGTAAEGPLVEAAVIALAVRRKKEGVQPSGGTAGRGSRQPSSEVADELTWLGQVAEGYVRLTARQNCLPEPYPCPCSEEPAVRPT